MNTRLPALALLALLASGAGVTAQEDTPLFVTAHSRDGDYWFNVSPLPDRNPVIRFEPGEAATVRFVNSAEMPHSLHFGAPLNVTTPMIHPGRERTLTFTVPADAEGTTHYWCDPHLQQGMVGIVAFADADAAEAVHLGEPDKALPGTPLALTLAAAAALALALRGRATAPPS